MFKIILSLISFLLIISTSFPRMTINITKGITEQTSVGILEFNQEYKSKLEYNISKSIAKNLNYSEKLKAQVYKKEPHKNKKQPVCDYLVVGNLYETKNKQYNVEFKLIKLATKKEIIKHTFFDLKSNQLQFLINRISNLIYEAILGEPGFFLSKLAYISVENPYSARKVIYKLVISNYDGSNPHVLIKKPRVPMISPTWSNNGEQIAYVSYDKGRMAIYNIDIFKKDTPRKLTDFKGINSSPSYSPNDKELVMALSKGYSEKTNIYLMNIKNKEIYKKLTNYGINTAPVFSPCGEKIAFTSDINGTPQILEASINKPNKFKTITNKQYRAFEPRYTPDGENIVFMYQKNKGTQIAIINLKTKIMKILTQGHMDTSPSVSNNGTTIFYMKGLSNGQSLLAMVSIDGRMNTVLPVKANYIQSPCWS